MGRYALILAGGCGRRLWPYSRKVLPKQFLRFHGQKSLFQQAWERAIEVVDRERVWVVLRADHVDLALEQVPELEAGRIVVEPVTRGTGAAVALVSRWIATEDPEAALWVMPSDHAIADPEPLKEAVSLGLEAAVHFTGLILLAVTPARPETQYGYIKPGPPWPRNPRFLKVERFHEKPPQKAAVRYIEDGCLWNTGMFIFSVRAFQAAMATHCPRLWEILEDLSPSVPSLRLTRLYRRLPSDSLDHLLVERMEELLAMPVEMEWEDLGVWQAHYARGRKDGSGNVVKGLVRHRNCSRSLLVAGPGNCIGASELHNMAVIVHDGAALVTPISHLDQAGELAEELDLEAEGYRALIEEFRRVEE